MKRLARNYNKSWLSLREISEEFNLPLPFLKQLMIDLRRAKLVKSKEGIKGGYRLSTNPKEISLGKIIRAFRGHISVTQCCSENYKSRCRLETVCPSKSELRKVGDHFIVYLEKIKLVKS